MSFADSVKKQVGRIEKEIDSKCYNLFKELAETVVYTCPILRGNLINDFWSASNSYNTTTRTPVDADFKSKITAHSDVTGSGSLGRITDVKDSKTFYGRDGFLSFSTSVPYAYQIEYLGHSPSKAPAGFMRVSLTKVAAKNRRI